MVSVANIQQLIVLETGDTPDSILTNNINMIWNSFADKAPIFPRLQELYTKRVCIEIVLGTLRNQVSFSMNGDLNLRLEQRSQYLKDRHKELCDEIVRVEKIAQATRPSVIGELVAKDLETPPPGAADSMSRRLIGSPYFPSPFPNEFGGLGTIEPGTLPDI